MNRKSILIITLTLLMFTFACSKKEETAPAPAPAPVAPAPAPEEVSEPEKPVVQVEPPRENLDDFDLGRIKLDDIYFEFDKAELTGEAKAALARYSEVLKANVKVKVLVEGHCDERGTNEYNLALGERRATRVREYMRSLGIDAERLKTISYGEEQPADNGGDEAAWAKNRRAHFQLSKDR